MPLCDVKSEYEDTKKAKNPKIYVTADVTLYAVSGPLKYDIKILKSLPPSRGSVGIKFIIASNKLVTPKFKISTAQYL